MHTFPLAEQIAANVKIPMKVCAVTKELYGYAHPVPNHDEAIKELHRVWFKKTGCPLRGEMAEAAIGVLERRMDSM